MSLLSRLEACGANRFRLPKEGAMQVDAWLYLDDNLRSRHLDEASLQQLRDAASLPGVHRAVLGMPDIHSGYGLPIGGVLACDARTGFVSAGAVGMDINCGVRLLSTNLLARDIKRPVLKKLLQAIVERVPTGIGTKSPYNLSDQQGIMIEGSNALIKAGYGRLSDRDRTEEGGRLAFARPEVLSRNMLKRTGQLGTLGGGNHFIEICEVSEALAPEKGRKFGLHDGYLAVMIHTGSRGFGHQVCTEFSGRMLKEAAREGFLIPNKGLAALPIGSQGGQEYLAAMACAVNYAFGNRQLITHAVREAFAHVLGGRNEDFGLDVVYDVAHNIAKFEEHDGKELLIHRKGATRALPPGHQANPQVYMDTGHPALLPGSMGTASYVVTGKPGIEETFCSVNHGAGRVMSRSAARRTISEDELALSMGGVITNASHYKRLLDEAPMAYKDIHRVVNVLSDIELVQKVAKLVPLAVIKGDGDE